MIQNTQPITWRNLIITFLPIVLPIILDWLTKRLQEDEEREQHQLTK